MILRLSEVNYNQKDSEKQEKKHHGKNIFGKLFSLRETT
jgi:hypothetical protein